MYDKRIRGCTNPVCERCIHGYSYKSTDRYCTICGQQLVFVCRRCHRPIEDQGIDVRTCPSCEAYLQKMKADGIQIAKEIPGGMITAAGAVPAAGAVLKKFVKKKSAKKLIDGAVTLADLLLRKKG